MNWLRKGRIISVSGVDCAGKSTQLDRLEAELRGRGLKVARLWFRPGYSSGLNAARRLIRRILPAALPTSAQKEARGAAFSSRRVANAWIMLALLDMLFHYGLRLRVLKLFGYTVLADRFAADGFLDLRLRFPGVGLDRWRLSRLAEWAFVVPEHALLLNLPHQSMLDRMEKKREPFPDSADIRDARYAAYQQMAVEGRFVVIDAEGSVDEVHLRVLRAVYGP